MDATIVFENPSDANQSLRNATVEPTTSATAQSPVVDLERIVFFEDEESNHFDFSDEEESEDEHADADPSEEFTEPAVEETFEAEVENQEQFQTNGPFFPFRDKIHLIMHQFFYRTGGDISQAVMTEIVQMVSDVVDAKLEYPEAKVHAADLLYHYDDPRRTKNQIPVFKPTTHTVSITRKSRTNTFNEELRTFSMIPPNEILKLLVANPSVADRLSRLPDDTSNELIDSYQAEKWRSHSLFQHPMISTDLHGLERHIWVNDVVKTTQKTLIAKRFHTLHHYKVMIEGYEVMALEQGNSFKFVNLFEKITVKVEDVITIICDDRAATTLLLPDDIQGEALQSCNDKVNKMMKPNPLKRPWPQGTHKFMPVKIIPLNLFTDDMSGNRTKKHNKFNSWVMVPAALPLAERHMLNNTAFICTDHHLSAMQMLPALVENLVLLEKGIEMMLPNGDPVVVIAPLHFISAENARHSEIIALSRGAASLMPSASAPGNEALKGKVMVMTITAMIFDLKKW